MGLAGARSGLNQDSVGLTFDGGLLFGVCAPGWRIRFFSGTGGALQPGDGRAAAFFSPADSLAEQGKLPGQPVQFIRTKDTDNPERAVVAGLTVHPVVPDPVHGLGKQR